jgi:hypothetical protein
MKFKHITLSIVLVVALAMMIPLAAAQTFVSAPATLSLGSKNQEASNPLDDDGPRVVAITSQITFSNTDPSNSYGVDLSTQSAIKAIVKANTKYTLNTELSFSSELTQIESLLDNNDNLLVIEFDNEGSVVTIPQAISATVPGTLDVPFTIMVPASLDAVEATTLLEKAFEVATFTFNAVQTGGTQIETAVVKVNMQRENLLEISDADAEINDKARESIDSGDKIENIKPGDKIELDVEVQNNYDNDAEVDIENVDLILNCDDDKDIDIDDKTLDIGDISADDEDVDTFIIIIEDDAKDGNIGCLIEAEGVDENGARHGENLDFDIEINRESHDIQLKLPISLLPNVITCADTSLQMTVGFTNLGKSDEDEVALEITSQDLNYQERRSDISLDEDDSEIEIFNIPLTNLGDKSPLVFTVRSFYDNVKSSDTETVIVENACTEGQITTTKDKNIGLSTAKGKIILDEALITTTKGRFNSIAVQITNNENIPVTFEVSLSGISDFATSVSPKMVPLQPGQTSTVFLNFKTKEDVDAGTYSGTVNLKSEGQTVDSQLFTVEVSGEAEEVDGQGFDVDMTQIFWVIGDIILILVAVFFIRLIFTGSKRKKKTMKMADYEAASRKRKR